MPAAYYAHRTAVVTGAGSGIGRALAHELARREARLALWDLDAAAVSDTGETCRRSGASVRVDVLDVTDAAASSTAAAAAREQFGGIDLAFCMAGVIHTGTVLESDPADLEHVVHVNLCGTLHTVAAVLPHVVQSPAGHIVTTSSGFGLLAAPRYSAYSASKFAIRGFTAALRQELVMAGHPVRATCVVPGGVRTPIIRHGRFADAVDAASVIQGFESRIARSTPQQAAVVILRELPRGRSQILVGRDARLLAGVARLTGGAYQRLVPWLLRHRSASATAAPPPDNQDTTSREHTHPGSEG